MTSSDVLRRELGAAQAELMECLVHDGRTPLAFDADEVLALRRLLLVKRRELLRRAAPQLMEVLGADFEPWFEEFRATSPPGGPAGRVDAEAFATWLVRRGLLGAGAPRTDVSEQSGGRRKRILEAFARCRAAGPRERPLQRGPGGGGAVYEVG